MYTKENVSQDIKNKILSLNVIEYKLNRSVYSTKGMKYFLPFSLAVIILFWILLGHKGILEFVSTGIFVMPFIIPILCYAHISTKVSNSIKKRDFYIVEDVVIDKIHKPGNAEDLPQYFFVFQNHGKYRLASNEEKMFNVANKGHICYLLLPTNGKKLRFIFDSQIWKISKKDFQFNNGVYSPYKIT